MKIQEKVYQLKIILKDSKPSIWRRVLVKENTTLEQLHYIFQIVMGWFNEHLHQFIIDNVYYTNAEFELDVENEKDESKYKIKNILFEGQRFIYNYDFGDMWIHEVVVEKILPVDKMVDYPICIAGKMQCPPENCGGIYGYYQLLEILKDKNHPEYEETLEWIGNEYDQPAINLSQINEALHEATAESFYLYMN